jgi:hypothetical protein
MGAGMAKAAIRFSSGNYIDRVSDACFVQLDEATVYFANRKIIALAAHDTFYRVAELDSGVVYKRLRAALQRHKGMTKVVQMKRADILPLVEAAVMAMGARLVDRELGLLEG